MNEKKGKSRCLDGERIPKCDYFNLWLGILILQLYHLLQLYSIIK